MGTLMVSDPFLPMALFLHGNISLEVETLAITG
jgi:hypothetical protein